MRKDGACRPSISARPITLSVKSLDLGVLTIADVAPASNNARSCADVANSVRKCDLDKKPWHMHQVASGPLNQFTNECSWQTLLMQCGIDEAITTRKSLKQVTTASMHCFTASGNPLLLAPPHAANWLPAATVTAATVPAYLAGNSARF